MKDVIDFNRVPPEQIAIHERLINWARWCRPRWGAAVHPMFKQAISAAREREDVSTAPPVNELDAQANGVLSLTAATPSRGDTPPIGTPAPGTPTSNSTPGFPLVGGFSDWLNQMEEG